MQENIKQVIVKMTARRAFRTEPIYQYDVGHELVFEGFELPAAFEVHFSRSPIGNAITQIGTDGICTVPDMFAQSAGVIYAWLYIADADTGLTKYEIEIPVAKRAKITDQQPTPVEQSAIDQAIAALNAGVEAAEDAQEAAEAAQASAESYAESAGDSAITATNAATSAATSAGNAAASATSAGTSATDANASRQAADLSATNAGISERNAAASATAAAGSATSAAASASQASGSATAASQSASQAASTVSGAVATINTARDSSVAAVQAKGDEVLDSIPADYSELSDDVDSLKSALNNKADVIISSASGSIASFDDGADNMPVKNLSVAIEPVQSGSGDPSPDNIRPISGHTAVTVTRTGGNLIDIRNSLGVGNLFGIRINIPAGTGIYVQRVGGVASSLYGVDSNGAYFALGDIWDTKRTMTLTKDVIAIGISSSSASSYGTGEYLCVSLTDFDSPEPYAGQTYPISWQTEAGTVYGGELTVNEDGTGQVVVDRKELSGTAAETGWSYSESSQIFMFFDRNHTDGIPVCNMYRGVESSGANNAAYAKGNNTISVRYPTTDRIYIRDDRFTDVASFQAAIAGIQIILPIEPITYTLTAQQLTTLLGSNRIWADCGDVSVDYCADTKLYIEQLTKPTEDDMKANTAITSGKFFMIGNRLFLAAAAIASGATIIPGTNCTELSLADALNNINV